MKITFLVTTVDNAAGTERAIITQANSLAACGVEIDIQSVYRTTGSPAFPLHASVGINYWVDMLTQSDISGTGTGIDSVGYGSRPSRVIPHEWDDQFSLLTDLVAGRILPGIGGDIIVASTPALSFLAGSLANPKVVIVAQEHRASMSRGKGFEPLRRAAQNIDCIVSLTQASNSWLSDQLDGSGVQLEVIPNALPEIFRPQSTTNEKVIIAAGRFAPGKQFGHLIDAFSRVSPKHPDWSLRIYGYGPLEDSLKSTAVRLNVAHSVQIMPSVKNLELEWPKASILALTSRSEGLSLVIMEAAGAGVPTVSYDSPTGPAELIQDGVSGILVALNDIASMASGLDRLMGDHKLRLEMGQAAKCLIGNYAPSIIDANWQNLYSELVAQARRTPIRSERSAERFAGSLVTSDLNERSEGSSTSIETKQVQSKRKILDGAELGYMDILERNRQIVDDILASGNVRYRELEGSHLFRAVLAIPNMDRFGLLEQLKLIEDPSISIEIFMGAARTRSQTWSPAFETMPMALQESTMLRIYGRFSDLHELTLVGAESAVEIEFWSTDEEDPFLYRCPRHNRLVDTLEEENFSRFGVSSVECRKTWSRIGFPIDIVYTWVNGGDPSWRLRKAIHLPEAVAAHDPAAGDARFTNRDELRYSIRSVRRYAPWVRNIFLVTDDQTPAWLDEESEIKVISHRDLFPDPRCLPTFNSHAIETTLHRIPGLAEHFLYCNDDTVLLRLQSPETYFTPNGLAKFFPSPVKINYLSNEVEPHIAAAINNREIIRDRFGMEISQSMLHTPHPHRRSVLETIESEQGKAVERTRSHRFRDPTDISLLSSLGQYYGYALEKYIPGSIRYTYIGLGRPETEGRLLDLLNGSRFDVATFGESNLGYDDPEETDRQLRQFFETKFSLAAIDERMDPLDAG